MQRIIPGPTWPLFDAAATRRIERHAAALLPPHTLMERAGLSIARLALALAPHARTVWIACGPGNNGGDGLETAFHLHQRGLRVVVSWLGSPEAAPPDARQSWQRAHDAGVPFEAQPPQGMGPLDLCIDALLGLGAGVDIEDIEDIDVEVEVEGSVGAKSPLSTLLAHLRASVAPVLAVDLPTGLQADTGQYALGFAPFLTAKRHTLSLLTLKPGLFTGAGRDAAGTVWFDNLAVTPGLAELPTAWLAGDIVQPMRSHSSHKGNYGDVAVIGGEGLSTRGMGMTGAAILAARAALHSGAGRVLVALLDSSAGLGLDGQQPELMFRHTTALHLEELTVVCGCGGGEAVRAVLPEILATAPRLVLDADALNALATDPALQRALQGRRLRGQITVLTPHPLEAARLLGTDVAEVQAHRLMAAQALAAQFHCVVVLKGSGTVVASPGQTPCINPTGNGRLASAGTGDVLAGRLGAYLAAGREAAQAAQAAVWEYGWAADQWPAGLPLTASRLACWGSNGGQIGF